MTTLIPLALFLIIQAAIQNFARKAQASLSNDEKARLLDASSQFYFIQIVPVIMLLFLFAGLVYLKPSIFIISVGLTIYILLAAISSYFAQHHIVKKLSAIDLPSSYISFRRKTSIIQNVSMLIFLIWMLGSYFWQIGEIYG